MSDYLAMGSMPEGKLVEVTTKLINEGNYRIKLDADFTDAILLLGNTGAGKTTVAKLLGKTGDLVCYRAKTNLLIRDQHDKISEKATLVSKTIFPELVVDDVAKTAFYDLPGFCDTRTEAIEIANACFIKKVAEHAKRVKLVFVISYSSLKTGGSRIEFKVFLEQAIALLKDPTKFTPSVALVVTKASGSAAFNDIIDGVVEFLEESKEVLRQVFPDGSECRSATSIIDGLLTKDSSGNYCRIGIFRKPKGTGPVNQLEGALRDKEQIARVIYDKTVYTPTSPDDFGLSISHKAKHVATVVVEKINQKVTEIMKEIGQKIQREITNQVNRSPTAEIGRLLNNQAELEEQIKSLRTNPSGDRRNFFEKLPEIVSRFNCKDLISNELTELKHAQDNLKFLDYISGRTYPASILDWSNPIQSAFETFRTAVSEKASAFAAEMVQIMGQTSANLDAAIQSTVQAQAEERGALQTSLEKFTNSLTQMIAKLYEAKSVNLFIQHVLSCLESLDLQVSTSTLTKLSVDVTFGTANILAFDWVRPFEALQGKVNEHKIKFAMEIKNETERAKMVEEFKLEQSNQENRKREADRKYEELKDQLLKAGEKREEEMKQLYESQRKAQEEQIARFELLRQEDNKRHEEMMRRIKKPRGPCIVM